VLGNVTVENYEELFSLRDEENGQLQPLHTISGLQDDYLAVMLANGRYRIASMRVLQDLFELGGKTMENIRIASGPIAESELRTGETNSPSKDQPEDVSQADTDQRQNVQPSPPTKWKVI